MCNCNIRRLRENGAKIILKKTGLEFPKISDTKSQSRKLRKHEAREIQHTHTHSNDKILKTIERKKDKLKSKIRISANLPI